jgi:hypothetical protein
MLMTSMAPYHVLASQGYGVSKVLAEKEACRFAEEHGISLVSVCPVLTVGAAPATKMDTSLHASLSLLSGCFQIPVSPAIYPVALHTTVHVMSHVMVHRNLQATKQRSAC